MVEAGGYYTDNARRQWWLVLALLLVATVAVLDRSILSLLADPIKRELHLSDTQVALVFGTSFSIANVLFTLPAGYLADRISRRGIIAAGCLVWSIMTGVCGLAGSYPQLLVARSGVGFAEAVIHPCSFAMLRGALSPSRRGRGFAIYGASLMLGSAFGFLFGGKLIKAMAGGALAGVPVFGATLTALSPWRQVLIVLAVIGIPAMLLLLTVREPRRAADAAAPQATMGQALRYMREHWPVFVPILIFSACSSMKANAYATFIASIPQRRWDIPVAAVGQRLGLMMLIAAPLGLWIMGSLSDRLVQRFGPRGPVMVAVASVLGGLVFSSSAPIAPTPTAFYWLACGDFFIAGGAFAIAGIVIAMITPAENMGKTSAVQLFVYGIIGLGVGPAVTGLISDKLYPGKAGIAQALSVSCAAFMSISLVMSIVLYFTIQRMAVRQADSEEGAPAMTARGQVARS